MCRAVATHGLGPLHSAFSQRPTYATLCPYFRAIPLPAQGDSKQQQLDKKLLRRLIQEQASEDDEDEGSDDEEEEGKSAH